ncbi:MAG: ArnT family glycosyltransferase [Opitutales bacterium]
MTGLLPTPPRWMVHLVVAAVLVLHALLAWEATAGKSVTADEILHLTGGAFYNRHGDFRLHPENGNLPQRWAALPVLLMSAPLPDARTSPYWQDSDTPMFGYTFLYESGFDHFPLLMAARAMVTVFSMGTGLLIFLWARRLWGTAGGGLALGLYALDPNVLAHAALVTSDAAATFFLLASAGAFWRHLRTPGWGPGALSAVTFGLACVAKFSAALLLPVFFLLLAWHFAVALPGERTHWARRAALTLASHAAAAVLIIWAFYDFRYAGFAPGLPGGHYLIPWEQAVPGLGLTGRIVEFCATWHLLPQSFLYGFAWVLVSAKARAAFLAGAYSTTGWVSFFPLAFLWKSPPALLAVLAGGLLLVARRWFAGIRRAAEDLTAVAPLIVFFLVYWAFSLASHLNIGHRHILPTYPVLYILAGGLLGAVVTRPLRLTLAAALLAGQAWTAAGIHPDYLAYFNVLAGGPANGWRQLVDSSLDWGQDLPGLQDWLARNNSGPRPQTVYLSYFGSGNPDYYGITAVRLPFVNSFHQGHTWSDLHGGLYAISATMLQEVYSPVRGDWTTADEKEYQEFRRLAPEFRRYFLDPAARPELLAAAPAAKWDRAWYRFECLRQARLCAYLRTRKPEAMIGYSIFIYRLSDEQVDRVLNRRYSDWLDALAEAPRSAQ